jgi:hypothetical protein
VRRRYENAPVQRSKGLTAQTESLYNPVASENAHPIKLYIVVQALKKAPGNALNRRISRIKD